MPASLLPKPSYEEVGWHTKANAFFDRINGLRNVDDTADADKPVSSATTAALAGKQTADADLTAIAGLDSSTSGAIASDGSGWVKKTYSQLKTALGLAKADVGLGSVDNTSDANKPISTATQEALDAKAATGHTHSASDVASGTLAIARIPTGTSGSTVAFGNHNHSGTYADASHTHSESDVTGLSSSLSGKSDTGHTHSYAATSHSHAGADITSGTVDIARLPTGTSGSTVALGNHTHAAYATTTTTDGLAGRLTVLEKPSVALTDASTVAINAALGSKFKVTIAGNRTLGNPSNAYDGQVILINVRQDGTGSRTVTLDTKYRLPTGTTLTWSTTASKKDKLLVQYDSTDDKFDVLAFQAGY